MRVQPSIPTWVQPAIPTWTQPTIPTWVPPTNPTWAQPAIPTWVQPAIPTWVQPFPMCPVWQGKKRRVEASRTEDCRGQEAENVLIPEKLELFMF
jgi:hypothetical protein